MGKMAISEKPGTGKEQSTAADDLVGIASPTCKSA